MPSSAQRPRLSTCLVVSLVLLNFLGACIPAKQTPPSPTSSPPDVLPRVSTNSPTPSRALPLLQTSTPSPAIVEPSPPTPIPTLPDTSLILPSNIGRLVEIDRLGKGPIQSLAWSPSGGQLAVASTTGIYIYNPQDFQKYQYIDTRSVVADLDYRPQGSAMAAALADGRLLLLDATSGNLRQQTRLPGPLTSVAYNPDGKQIAIGSLDPRLGIQIWDATGVNLLHLLTGRATANTLAYNRDGSLLAALFEDGVAVWDTLTGQRAALLQRAGTLYPTSLVFHTRENKIVIGSDLGRDNSLDLYLLPHGGHLRILFGHKDAITSIAMHPDGRTFASSSSDGTIQFWKWDTLERSTLITPQSPTGPFDALAMAYDLPGRRLAYAGRSNLLIWDLSRRQVVGSAEGHFAWDAALAISPDGSQFAGSSEGQTIELWDVNLRQILRRLEDTPGPIQEIDFSARDFLLAAGSANGGAAVWDLLTGQLLFQSPGEQPWMSAQTLFTPDGQLLLVANGSLLSIYTPRSGEQKASVDCEAVITALAISPGSDLLISAHQDGSLQVRRFPDLSLLNILASPGGWPIGQLAFSPDGRHLAAAQSPRSVQPGVLDAPRVQLWDLVTGQPLEFDPPPGQVNRLVLSPNGQVLAAAGGEPVSSIYLWDVGSGRLLRTLAGHSLPIVDLTFSPDGELLVSASQDGTVRRWGIPPP